MTGPDLRAVIVPGFMPLQALRPMALHPRAIARLRRGVALARARGIPNLLVSGGAVHPEGTPYVEADEMAEWLLRQGWPPGGVLRDPKARHTHTNLRNAGRLMLERGWGAALVASDAWQSFYIASPRRSGLHGRSLADLGYWPGAVRREGLRVTRFEPSPDVFRPGPDPLDP